MEAETIGICLLVVLIVVPSLLQLQESEFFGSIFEFLIMTFPVWFGLAGVMIIVVVELIGNVSLIGRTVEVFAVGMYGVSIVMTT
jgi:hypothetical protein